MTWLRTTQELQDQLNTKVSLSDPRLSDARTASDVSNWAKQSEKPTYMFSEITNKPSTIAGYGITDAPVVNQKVIRVFKFCTYDSAGYWLAGNDSSMFGGRAPSTWSDGNGQASDMQHTAGTFQTKVQMQTYHQTPGILIVRPTENLQLLYLESKTQQS